MTLSPSSSRVDELIRRLDEAVEINDDAVRCQNVKHVLMDVMGRGESFVEPRFLKPVPDKYARRLLHRDPQNRYTVLVMVWGPGQQTPLHDHAGIWCVECVYRGRIRVTSYGVRGGNPETGVVQFSRETEVYAGPGEAGALIPPFEYHVLANAENEPSVTIHVYGGELDHCHVFEPVDGGWQRRYRPLAYTQD